MRNLILFTSIVLLYSCSKGDGNGAPDTSPNNLTITTNIATNGSGTVEFVAQAENAVNYFFEFGNGAKAGSTNGRLTYAYPEEGNRLYTVTVTAVNSDGKSAKKSIDITVNRVLTLAWSEEFNTDGAPDPAVWGYDLGGGGWGNNELEYYTNRTENVQVQGGYLRINLIKENYSGATYTSARILTKDKFAFTYGKVVTRAKLPAGGGTWPAIWMLGANIGTAPWPACGEIDIMEHIGNSQDRIYGTLHYPDHSGANANGNSILITGASTEFHDYAMEWTPVSIKFYVDNQLFHSVANSASIPFNHDFFLIVNIAMGGNFGGTADPTVTQAGMEVDYIRLYK